MQKSHQMILVTGGSSGIGLALARLYAQRGERVWLVARREETLQKAVQELEQLGGGPHGYVAADITVENQAYEAVQSIGSVAGVPDVIINSAGISQPGYLTDVPAIEFQRVMDTNYMGTIHITQAALPGMIRRGSGHILNLSSIAGCLGLPGYAAYTASKYAIRGLSDSLRAELKPLGIRVSVAFPGDVETPFLEYENTCKPPELAYFTSLSKPMKVEPVARQILRGMDQGRYVILPGSDPKLLFSLIHLLGNAVYPVVDWLGARGRKRQPG